MHVRTVAQAETPLVHGSASAVLCLSSACLEGACFSQHSPLLVLAFLLENFLTERHWEGREVGRGSSQAFESQCLHELSLLSGQEAEAVSDM